MPAATTWMGVEGIRLSEISQTEEDKHHMISFTCRIYIFHMKAYMYIYTNMVARGREWGRCGRNR